MIADKHQGVMVNCNGGGNAVLYTTPLLCVSLINVGVLYMQQCQCYVVVWSWAVETMHGSSVNIVLFLVWKGKLLISMVLGHVLVTVVNSCSAFVLS